MKRLLPLLMLLLATLEVTTSTAPEVPPLSAPEGATAPSKAANKGIEAPSGAEWGVTSGAVGGVTSEAEWRVPSENENGVAMIDDARCIYRLSNTRPQRLLPSHGSKPGKSTGRSFAVRRPHHKHFFFLHDGRRRLETAPFQSAASRDYYVFALRHILC